LQTNCKKRRKLKLLRNKMGRGEEFREYMWIRGQQDGIEARRMVQ
jgi:hypothetical protein